LFEKLPDGIPLPSIADICSWAGVSEGTRDHWLKVGVVRRIAAGANEAATLELVLVAHIERFVGLDVACMAWPEIEPAITSLDLVPERLDLLWLKEPPQARLVSTDHELAAATLERPRSLVVVPLAKILLDARKTWHLYITKEWRALAARREAEELGAQKRGPKPKAARLARP
jgi:hypothetical protein